MFTGIVEEFGIVDKLTAKKNLMTLRVKADQVTKGLKAGESVSIDGVCLTVVNLKNKVMTFDVMKESLAKTTLGNFKPKQAVNLERALKAGHRLGGHFVTGHIDSVGTIREISKQPNYVAFKITMPSALRRYIVPKGSITVDGVSLTVGEVKQNSFTVYLIPYTLKVTNLGKKKAGDRVNLETDILAKYIFETKKSSKKQLRKYLTKV
jgi:riboflavin synthase